MLTERKRRANVILRIIDFVLTSNNIIQECASVASKENMLFVRVEKKNTFCLSE